jgi:hypothetical protein
MTNMQVYAKPVGESGLLFCQALVGGEVIFVLPAK